MKKKIIFMVINMNIGGTEKALLNMVGEIPRHEYDITILMLEKYGGFLSHIPEDVLVKYVHEYKNIKKLINDPPLSTALKLLKRGKIIKGINLSTLHLFSKITSNKNFYYNYILAKTPKLEDEYDIAVAYAGPMDFISYFVINKIKAKKKIQWIHFDITKIGFNPKVATKLYSKFNQILVVSNDGKKNLLDKIPSLRNKTGTFYNIISKDTILKLANQGEGFTDDFKGIRILTVGRLSNEKGYDLAIRAMAGLKKEGLKVRWYSIGDGSERKYYEKLIKENNLEQDFILLGTTPNPYPFFQQCDLYVQPSRHEGYCITLAEAICFNKPIISTNFTGASEQIIHNKTGLLVPFDEIKMYESIKMLVEEEKFYIRLSKNLTKTIPNNHVGIEKILESQPK